MIRWVLGLWLLLCCALASAQTRASSVIFLNPGYSDEPFWAEDAAGIRIVGTTDGEWAEWVNLLPVVGQPALMGFNAGSTARRLEALDDGAVVASALAALRAAYG